MATVMSNTLQLENKKNPTHTHKKKNSVWVSFCQTAVVTVKYLQRGNISMKWKITKLVRRDSVDNLGALIPFLFYSWSNLKYRIRNVITTQVDSLVIIINPNLRRKICSIGRLEKDFVLKKMNLIDDENFSFRYSSWTSIIGQIKQQNDEQNVQQQQQ